MRMLRHRAKPEKRLVAHAPLLELSLHGGGNKGELREVSIVKTKTADKFPNPFDGVEIRTVGRKEKQLELRLLSFSPLPVHTGVVVLGIVRDDHDATSRAARYPAELPEESPRRLRIKPLGLLLREKLAIAQTDGAKVSHGLASRMMQQNGIPDFGRDPHPTPRTMLLKMNFINSPKVNVWIGVHFAEFF
jgi:hypothetical protein